MSWLQPATLTFFNAMTCYLLEYNNYLYEFLLLNTGPICKTLLYCRYLYLAQLDIEFFDIKKSIFFFFFLNIFICNTMLQIVRLAMCYKQKVAIHNYRKLRNIFIHIMWHNTFATILIGFKRLLLTLICSWLWNNHYEMTVINSQAIH